MMQDLVGAVVEQLRAEDASMPRPMLVCNHVAMFATIRNGVRSFTVTKHLHQFHFQKPWDALNIFCLMACPTWSATSTIGLVISPNKRDVLFDVPIMRNMYDVPSLRKIGSWVIQVVFFSHYACHESDAATSIRTSPVS